MTDLTTAQLAAVLSALASATSDVVVVLGR